MKKLGHLISLLKQLEKQVWPEHTYVISQAMQDALAQRSFVVADVGAAYGTDPRWCSIEPYTRFVTFEPDSRSQDDISNTHTVNFATGLSDYQGEKSLYLTQLPAASSLYPLNINELKSFANYEWHEIVGEATIALDTLDRCLAERPELKPDFLKVDVEGSDLDVLKGGIEVLSQNVLGVQVEVSFIERHVGAPFFSDVDSFLREQGFALFILAREHWLRQNRVWGCNSHPQLIWADAVYVLTKEQFLNRLKLCPQELQFSIIVKFLVICLGYGLHDYAIEVIAAVEDEKIIGEDVAQELKQSIVKSVVSPVTYGLRCLSGIGVTSMLYVLGLPFPPLRRRVSGYLRKHWLNLLRCGVQQLSRSGIYGSSLSDPL
jgi:FkbM family methyltransferase